MRTVTGRPTKFPTARWTVRPREKRNLRFRRIDGPNISDANVRFSLLNELGMNAKGMCCAYPCYGRRLA